MKKSMFGALVLVAGVATPAGAQTDTIATLLAKGDELMAAQAYQPEGWSQTGSLTAASERTFTWEPSQAKGFILLGVCDQGCDDLDLALEDANGKEVASDKATDDSPIVQIGRLAATSYTVRVTMAKCKAGACRFAVRSYRTK